MPKYRAGNSGHKIEIKESWHVLDVGSGHNPHPRADVLLDKNIKDNTDRSGKAFKVKANKVAIQGDAEAMPFCDKKFNYILASHIAEHVTDPEKFCKELVRVGERGYIETPSKFAEILFDEPFHRWYVYTENGKLIFKKIASRERLGLLGKFFYAVFYINIERERKNTIILSNKYLRYISNCIVSWLIRKPLVRFGRLYTSFEWDESFEIEVKK